MALSALPSGLGWPDGIGAAFVLVFALLGCARGLWWQLVRLLALSVAIALARLLAPELSEALRGALPDLDARVAHGLCWLVLFALALAGCSLIGQLGKGAIEILQLDLVDRAGGALAGALTGLLLHGAFLVALTQLAPHHWLVAELAGTRSAALVDLLSRALPLLMQRSSGEELQHWFRAGAP